MSTNKISVRILIEILTAICLTIAAIVTAFQGYIQLDATLILLIVIILSFSLITYLFLALFLIDKLALKDIKGILTNAKSIKNYLESCKNKSSIVVNRDNYLKKCIPNSEIYISGATLQYSIDHSDIIIKNLKKGIKYRYLCIDKGETLNQYIKTFYNLIKKKMGEISLKQIRIRKLSKGHFPLVIMLYDPTEKNGKCFVYFPLKFSNEKYRDMFLIEDKQIIRDEFLEKFNNLWEEAGKDLIVK